MFSRSILPRRVGSVGVLVSLLATSGGCLRELYPDFLKSDDGSRGILSGSAAGAAFSGNVFSENLIQERTFTDGSSVTTVAYATGDLTRKKLAVDFNGDHKVDPVVSYGDDQAVVQILLSKGAAGTVDFTSLTLDQKRDMTLIADVAVGDIDGDGKLDLVTAAEGAVWYLHHPSDSDTTVLRDWGVNRIDASSSLLTNDEITAIVTQAIGIATNLNNYVVTVEQTYRNVEIADFDGDGDDDVAGTRNFKIQMDPLPGLPLQPILIVSGDVLIFGNPGGATDGAGFTATSVGVHERPAVGADRDGASGLLVYDLDGDGDFDVVSSAREDNNVQVAWFRNPGGELRTDNPWTQWRVGSIRDAWSVDIGDVTGDGRVDVVATGGEQKQLILFVQPTDGPDRDYDWDGFPIVTFETYEPRDVKLLDLDGDGTFEVVIGGTGGALRYFTNPAGSTGADGDATEPWNAFEIVTFDPAGDVGLLGYGDLDGDSDLDLVAIIAGVDDPNDSHVVWVRNDSLSAESLADATPQ